MNRIILLVSIVLLTCLGAIAGINEKLSASTQLLIAERDGKISLDVKMPGPKLMTRAPLLRTQPVERHIAKPEDVNGVQMVPAFIHVDPKQTSKLESIGVIIQERFNEFVTALIPVNKIERIAELVEVKQVNVARKLQKKTNMARSYTNADDVINYTSDAVSAGLPMAFKGNGVVVGVIDGGIDFAHTLYNDASGNTRIKRAYKATSSTRLTEYTSGFTTISTDDSEESHGTHTSTTAAGRNMTVGNITYGGMAPESDIILVGLGSYMYDTNIANAIKKIFDYADSQNEPAVCSLSLGSHYGPHDGTGELADVYAQYAGSNPNHIIVYAASNDANSSYGYVHVEGTASSSTPLTAVIQGCLYEAYYGYGSSYRNRSYYGQDRFYARTKNQPLACRLHVVNTSNRSIVWTSNAITSSTSSISGLSTYFSGSPQVTIARDSYSNKYYVEVYTSQMNKTSSYQSNNYALAVSVYPTNGSCVIDGWVNGYNYFSDFSGTLGNYTFVAASDASCISDEASDDNVISVGAYCSKRVVSDYRGSSHTLSDYTLGDIAYFSSYQASGSGPLGAVKPDICAPGATIVAGINHNDNYYMQNQYSDYGMYLVYNSTTSSLGSMDGTSMATPCAAGIIALYLQAAKYAGKTLNTDGIRDVFANTAITDNYTSKVNFGRYGKIDALAGVKYILGSTELPDPQLTVDPASLSFSANVGQTTTKTFTITGTDLVGDVNLNISGGNGAYSITPTTITAAQAAAGATVTVTYAPTAAGSTTATVTASSSGADNVTVSLSGTATTVPTLTVNPTSLSFNTTVGQPVTQTFTVNGNALTSTVYLSVSGNGFTIDKTNITRNAANNNTSTITVTYNPTAAGNHTGTVTITSNGAETKTVTLNGTAVEPVRTITASTDVVNMNTLVGETVTSTFTVTGENLTGNLSLALNDANGVFSVTPQSITAANAMQGATITVTYAPTAFGNHTGSIIISGGGASAVTVNLNATANLVKYAPVMQEANDAYVTLTGFRAEWTDESPDYSVSSYTLEVNKLVETPEVTELASCDFSSLQAQVNSSNQLTNQVNNVSTYLPTGWGASVGMWVDDGCIISGQLTQNYNSYICTINSATYDLTGYDKMTVVMNVSTFDGDAVLNVATSKGSQDISITSSEFSTITIVLDCAESDAITLTGVSGMYCMQSISIYAGDLNANQMSLKASETGNTVYRLITGITPDKFYEVKDLEAGGTFSFHVKAIYTDGTESEWSNLEWVILHNREHLAGDANHDGEVSVVDVTLIINHLLGGNTEFICEECADADQNGEVDINDVTYIINNLLNASSMTIKGGLPKVHNSIKELAL